MSNIEFSKYNALTEASVQVNKEIDALRKSWEKDTAVDILPIPTSIPQEKESMDLKAQLETETKRLDWILNRIYLDKESNYRDIPKVILYQKKEHTIDNKLKDIRLGIDIAIFYEEHKDESF